MQKRVIQSFGRRVGRKITGSKKKLMEELLPKILVQIPIQKQILKNKIIIEIGFGDGVHLLHLARNNPEHTIIGCEVFHSGIAAVLFKIDEEKINNIQIFNDDARLMLKEMPRHSVDKIFILFPDPWPKVRHHKRRIINHNTLEMLHNILTPGGKLRIATDHSGYKEWILDVMEKDNHFKPIYKSGYTDEMPEDHIITKYQQKALAGEASYFEYINKS